MVLQVVVIFIEQEINGILGMFYMELNSFNFGGFLVMVIFDVFVDLDLVVVEIQNWVKLVESCLLVEVI